ncbi:MAG: SRPBCC domain-containing protein [Hyphomicrobiaceae bacterium]|nr:SRPBCC domain-containing protein [Hyphomicrobiaceae bacterium]
MLAKPSLTLKRRINATPEKVYAAWTDAEKLVGWFGPSDTKIGSLRASLDVRVGGRYQINFATEDGEAHQVSGSYREVVPGRRLVFTWAWVTTPERQSLVTVTVAPDGAGTLLTLHHEQFFDETARDGHQRGWTGTLDRLDRYLTA